MSEATKTFALHLKIAGAKANRRARMPKARPSTGIERDYGEALANYLEPRVREAFAPLMLALPGLLSRVQTRQDSGEEKQLLAIIESARKSLDRTVSESDIKQMAEKFGRQTSAHQRTALNRQVKAVFGVETPVLTDRRLRSRLEAFSDTNAALIRDIGPKMASEISALVVQAAENGTLHKTLAADLETRFGLVRKRARLIARDQMGKLYGQVARIRHEELGITAFIWRSVNDRRVRGTPKALHGKYPNAKPSHYLRNGVRYTYAGPPKGRDGKPEYPGQPVLCRCYPDPDFGNVLDELDRLEGKTPPPAAEPEPQELRLPLAPPTPPVARTKEAAARRIAEGIHATDQKRSGYPGINKVEANWLKRVDLTGIDASEFDALDAAIADNNRNREFAAMRAKYETPEVVVLTKPEKNVRHRAERLGATTFVYDTPLSRVKVLANAPVPGVATSEEWGGIAATLRHEYAHTIYDQTIKDPDRYARWLSLKTENARAISKYAASKEDELFAETFAVVTDRKYDPGQFDPSDRAYLKAFREFVGLPGDK